MFRNRKRHPIAPKGTQKSPSSIKRKYQMANVRFLSEQERPSAVHGRFRSRKTRQTHGLIWSVFPLGSSLAPPELISHYRIVRRLGVGGMGEVFLAEDIKLDRAVALKLLPKEVSEDGSRRKRFLAEAKAASALNHINVCTIYEVGETAEGQPFIAMEYVEGLTLDVLARRRRLELREIVGVGLQVAEALEAARQSQVVHRDIKPGNIMVDARGRVKVVDFGLAKRLDQSGEVSTLTQEGAIIGTPNYLSPELALGREVDSRSDIFSLGVVLYELAAGKNPFAGGTFGEKVNNILNHEPAPLRPWNP